jgi:hypothetical protein
MEKFNKKVHHQLRIKIKPMQRLILYTKDVQVITGKSDKAARDLLRKVKTRFNKTRDQFVTADEFSEVTGIKIALVLNFLRNH